MNLDSFPRPDCSDLIVRKGTNCEKWDRLDQVSGRDDLLPMWVADMDLPVPPEVVKAIKLRAGHPAYGYTFRPDSYYQAFIDWALRRHGWQINFEWLSDAPGVIPALALCINALTDPGDQILIQTPVYGPFYHVVSSNNRKLATSPLLEDRGYYRMNYDDLAAKFAKGVKMLILCNPHNPVGRVWTLDELRHLGELCLAYDVKIVADEIWADLVFPPFKYHPMAAAGHELARQTITLMAPSKTFNIAGLHNSVAVIPNKEWKRSYDQATKRAYLGFANVFSVTAFTAAYCHGGEWLDQLLPYLKSNCDQVVAALDGYCSLRVRPPEGTYLVWLDFRGLELDQDLLIRMLVEHGKIGLSDGRFFGREGDGFMRMNVGCPRSMVMDGISRIKKSIACLSGETESEYEV